MDKDMKDMNIAELDQKDLEKVTGGTFTLNYYWRSEYEDAGIKVVTHFIDKDEFWWNGENIGEKGANSVVFFTAVKGHAPVRLKNRCPSWTQTIKRNLNAIVTKGRYIKLRRGSLTDL